jgi:hypothetical protein
MVAQALDTTPGGDVLVSLQGLAADSRLSVKSEQQGVVCFAGAILQERFSRFTLHFRLRTLTGYCRSVRPYFVST